MAAFTRWLTATPSLTISGPGADGTHYDTVLRALGQPTTGSYSRLKTQLLKDDEITAGYEAQRIIEDAKRLSKSV